MFFFFFSPLLQSPSSPSWLGRCHCSRSVIGCQTTTTHNQSDLVSLLMFLPFPLPCIYVRPFMMRWNRDVFQLFQIIPNLSKIDWKELPRGSMEFVHRDLGHNFSLGVRSSESLYLINYIVQEGREENKMQKQCNRSLTDISYYNFSGILSVMLIFLIFLFPISIWKVKISIRVNETASSDFL